MPQGANSLTRRHRARRPGETRSTTPALPRCVRCACGSPANSSTPAAATSAAMTPRAIQPSVLGGSATPRPRARCLLARPGARRADVRRPSRRSLPSCSTRRSSAPETSATPPRPAVPAAGVVDSATRKAPPRPCEPGRASAAATANAADDAATPPLPSVPAAGVVAAEPLLKCAAPAACAPTASASSSRSDRDRDGREPGLRRALHGSHLPPDAAVAFRPRRPDGRRVAPPPPTPLSPLPFPPRRAEN